MADQSEWITVAEAREVLGVSKPKMAQLLKEGRFLHAEENPVDKRSKLLRRDEVEAFRRRLPGKEAA